MSTWVPAVHAGTTNSYRNVYTTCASLMAKSRHPDPEFSKEVAKATKSGGFETRPYIFLRPLHLRLNFSCFVAEREKGSGVFSCAPWTATGVHRRFQV